LGDRAIRGRRELKQMLKQQNMSQEQSTTIDKTRKIATIKRTQERNYSTATTGLKPIDYRGALLSSLLQVNVYITHNLLIVLVQIANKMGSKRKKKNKDRNFQNAPLAPQKLTLHPLKNKTKPP
jgi:hypothetical protein